jgi:hypothetical protein
MAEHTIDQSTLDEEAPRTGSIGKDSSDVSDERSSLDRMDSNNETGDAEGSTGAAAAAAADDFDAMEWESKSKSEQVMSLDSKTEEVLDFNSGIELPFETPVKSNVSNLKKEPELKNGFNDNSQEANDRPNRKTVGSKVSCGVLNDEGEKNPLDVASNSSDSCEGSWNSQLSLGSDFERNLPAELSKQPSNAVMTADRRLSMTVDLETGKQGTTRAHRAMVRDSSEF